MFGHENLEKIEEHYHKGEAHKAMDIINQHLKEEMRVIEDIKRLNRIIGIYWSELKNVKEILSKGKFSSSDDAVIHRLIPTLTNANKQMEQITRRLLAEEKKEE